MLGNIAGGQVRQIPAGAVHMADGAAVGKLSQQGPDQGRFSGAVLADQHRQLAAVNMHGNILQKKLATPADRDLIQVDVAQGAAGKSHQWIPP